MRMVVKKQLVLALLFVFTEYYEVRGYSREKLQQTYPGFGTEYVLFPGEDNNPVIGYLKMDNTSRLFGIGEFRMDQDVKYEYFSRDYLEGVPITSKNEMKKYVNISKPTKFITHGWMSGGRKDSSIALRNGFLYKYDANIFVMDWSAISGNPFYPIPMMATPDIGKYYGTYLNYLVDDVGVNPEDIHLVGHSLGAHVSGFAGRELYWFQSVDYHFHININY